MVFYDNWAVVTKETSVLWTWGGIDEEKASLIAGLAKGLHDVARELFDESVTSILLTDEREVLIAQIGGDFFLITSDPVTTAKLLRLAKIPSDIESLTIGVLIGHGVQTYANLWSAAQSDVQAKLIDSIFQEALAKLDLPESANVDIGIHQGACNLSGLSLPDLLFFHSYVRRRIAEERDLDPEGSWGFVQAAAGVPIPLEYRLPASKIDPHITAGLISVIVALIKQVFDSNPKKIIFAEEAFPALDLLVGDTYYLATNYAVGLFQDSAFLDRFFSLPAEIQHSLELSIREAISNQILLTTHEKLQEKDIHALIRELREFED